MVKTRRLVYEPRRGLAPSIVHRYAHPSKVLSAGFPGRECHLEIGSSRSVATFNAEGFKLDNYVLMLTPFRPHSSALPPAI